MNPPLRRPVTVLVFLLLQFLAHFIGAEQPAKPAHAVAFSFGTLLGKDASTYSKSLGIPLDPSIRKSPPLVTREGKIPNLGHILLNIPGTADPDKPDPVKSMDTWFDDFTIKTWQLAFAKIGIPIESAKEEKNESGEIIVVFPAPNGKNWKAYFYPPLTEEQSKNSGRNPNALLTLVESRK